MAKRFKFTDELDHDLLDQVALINPFQQGKTWADVAAAAREAQPAFKDVVTKTLQDRANRLLDGRKDFLSGELKASGIEGKPLTDLDKAKDEALLLREEGERVKNEKKHAATRKEGKAVMDANKIRDAALGLGCKVKSNHDDKDEVDVEGPSESGTGTRGKRSALDRVADVIEKKLKAETESRKMEVDLRQEELRLQREQLQFQKEQLEHQRELMGLVTKK